MSHPVPDRPDTPRDRRIPYYFALFLFVFVGLDVLMAYIAVRTNPGVLQENAYEVGLKYNDVIAAAAALEKRGIKGDVRAVPDGKGNVTILLTLTEKGQGISGLTGTVRLIRTVQAGFDQSGAFEPVPASKGRYQAILPLPLEGAWTVEVTGHSQTTGDYTLSKQVTIP